MSSKKKKHLLRIVQFLITGLLLYFIFRKIDLNETKQILLRIDLITYFLAVLVTIFGFQFFYVLRWKVLLKYNGITYPFIDLLKYHFLAVLSQNFLPSSIGGDVVRGLFTAKKGERVKAINVILFARVFGLFVLLIIVLLTMIFIDNPIINRFKIFIFSAFLLIMILGGVFFFFNSSFNRILNRFKAYIYFKEKFRILEFYRIFISYFRSPRLIGLLLLLTLVIHVSPIFGVYFIFRSLGIAISLLECIIYLPLIIFLVILPVSINGYGMREGLLLISFQSVLTTASLFSFSILSFLFNLFFLIIYLFILLIKRRKKVT
ncbi:MAG: flippase-like domain-containing protein [Spirochaetes bacterium]|nr:flippase-like domain-containing protein [Spirochaetota bacterium]